MTTRLGCPCLFLFQVVEDKVVTALVPEGTVPGPASSDSTGKTTTGGAGAGSTGQGLSSRTATAPPPSKRPRTEPEAATGGKGISLAIVCVAGGGLEEQELEVEVDEKMTVRALKQSLAEADLGPGITADKLVLRDEATGSKLMVSVPHTPQVIRSIAVGDVLYPFLVASARYPDTSAQVEHSWVQK